MSYDTKMDTITVNNVEYDVERGNRHSGGEILTISFNDEPVFDGLEGTLGYEEDNYGMSPREWSNVGTMSVSYHGYDLGDEDIRDIDFTVECDRCTGQGERPFLISTDDGALREFMVQCAKCDGYGELQTDPVSYFKKERGARVVIGLTVYEHSGITMRAGDVTLPFDTDRWDTSFVGFIFDTPEQLKETMGDDVTDEQIEEALRQEVATYAAYLEGDITCYSVQDDETGFMEACGGYVGDHEQCERECFEALESAIVKRIAENNERDHWNSRDVPTI